MTPCASCLTAPVESVVIDSFSYVGLECTGCGARSVITNAPRAMANETAMGAFALWLNGDAVGIGYDPSVGVFCEVTQAEDEATDRTLRLVSNNRERP